MRRFFARWLLLALSCSLLVPFPRAAEFKLEDGSTIRGRVSRGDEYGIIFKLDTGGFSSRYSWGKFSQDTLKQLVLDPKLQEHAEPFIEIPPEERPKPKPIRLQEVAKVELPSGRTSFFSSFTAPLGLAILVLLYAANLYAAYEIAIFRNRPVAVVCGVSALIPVVGPLIFLASPSLEGEPEEALMPGEEVAPAAEPAVAPAAAGKTSRKVGLPSGGGLRMAAVAKTRGKKEPADAKVYKRGDYTFNRRFIETQFSGYFRIVPTDAERDMLLVVKTAKREYVAKRISRITANEMFVQMMQTGGKEVRITLGEIAEIVVRHKDDKGG